MRRFGRGPYYPGRAGRLRTLRAGTALRSGMSHQPHREVVWFLDFGVVRSGARNLAVAQGATCTSCGELVFRRLNHAVASGAVGHVSQTMRHH